VVFFGAAVVAFKSVALTALAVAAPFFLPIASEVS
jgi:hypothetical protein